MLLGTPTPHTGPAPGADAPHQTSTPWPCWVEVDLDAVAHNVRTLHRAARPRQGVIAVVKSQAYGLGAAAVAEAAMRGGAIGAAVARAAEGALLRTSGFRGPILVLGAIAPGEAADIIRHDLTPTVTDWTTTHHLAARAGEAGVQLGVHVKVDTGMNRYGAAPDEAAELVRGLRSLPALRLAGFYTHFAAADEPDLWFTSQQVARYRALCRQLESEGIDLGIRHAANSAGALRLPDAGFDAVRTGIALSGSYATAHVPRIIGASPPSAPGGARSATGATVHVAPVTGATLRGAVALKARVARLNSPAIGASIGYGRTYKVERPLRTALISCGYADGLPRATSNRGQVLVHGQRAPLVGTVSMDLAIADITHIPDVAVGDEVVILGRQGEDEITVDELAQYAGIIPHELLVRLGSRAPRLYLENNTPTRAAALTCDRPLDL